MKQKITARAIIKENNKVLLIRRASGTPTLLKQYELPGGRVEYSEHPIDSLKRELREELDVAPETVQLHNALSYFDIDERSSHYVELLYNVTLSPSDRTIRLSHEHDKYLWKKVSEIQPNEITEAAALALEIAPNVKPTDVTLHDITVDEEKTTYTRVIAYSDGGSRGNPGPSAAGYVILDPQDNLLFEGGKYLGVTTNNQAEYQAVFLGLEKAKDIGAKHVDFRMDSLLVVNQLNGAYRVKNHDLWPIYERIKDLCTHFEKVSFRHVRREYNQLADGMVNRILDAQETS